MLEQGMNLNSFWLQNPLHRHHHIVRCAVRPEALVGNLTVGTNILALALLAGILTIVALAGFFILALPLMSATSVLA